MARGPAPGNEGTHEAALQGSAWARRLAALSVLAPEDRGALDQADATLLSFDTHDSIGKVDEPADNMFVVLAGVLCDFRLLSKGRRQVLGYLFAGDMTDPRQLLLPRWNHSLCALWPSRVAALPPGSVRHLERRPQIARAFARYELMRQAISREWLVNIGNRTAFERLGHLLCETFQRLQLVGLTVDHAFELPLTQADLADTLALSVVHLNRTLMELRRLGLVTFQNRQAVIHDFQALSAAAGFDPSYLQVSPEPLRATGDFE